VNAHQLKERPVIRPLEPETDLGRLLRLFNDIEEYNHDPEPTTEAHLRQVFAWPKHHRWVMPNPSDPDQLIGYGLVFAQTSERSVLWVAIHPDWRRKGLGRVMLVHVLDRARELNVNCVTISVDEQNAAGHAFLRQHGFWPVGHEWIMHVPADLALQEPQWPAGYSVRSFAEVQAVSGLVEVQNRSRRDMWGHWENTPGAVTEETVARWLPHWDPASILLAFAPDGDMVGICRMELAQEDQAPDVLDAPTIVPEHRDKLLQRPLVLAALHWQHSHRPRAVRLESWGDSEQTVEVYCGIGFAVSQHSVAYRYDLDRR
jgi:GNAT superfamily N-acetyltransferase